MEIFFHILIGLESRKQKLYSLYTLKVNYAKLEQQRVVG